MNHEQQNYEQQNHEDDIHEDDDMPFWRLPIIAGWGPDSVDSVDSADAIAEAFPPPTSTKALASYASPPSPGSPPPTPPPMPTLSQEDQDLLDDVDKRRAYITNRVTQVVERMQKAFFLWGPPGGGKGWTIIAALAKYEGNPNYDIKHIGGDISAKALFNLLRDHTEYTIVFDDMELMWQDRRCQQLLRQAMSGVMVSWERDGDANQQPFLFQGGIIIVCNEQPRISDHRSGAIGSRTSPTGGKCPKPRRQP